MSEKRRVFVADDHTIVREGIVKLVNEQEDLVVVGEAADGRAVLLAMDGPLAIDVLLLDLSLPKVDGTEVLRRVREKRPEIAIVILSAWPADQFGPRMTGLGAWAYLSKNSAADEVLAAVRGAGAGQRASERPAVNSRADKLPHEKLSPREYQVFMLLLRGRSNVEIAVELNLTPGTVSFYFSKVREKLCVRTNAEIAQYAHRAGLID